MELPFDPAISLLGIYPKNPKASIQKDLCTPMFIAVLFTITKCWKQPKYPSADECIKTCGTFTQWNTREQKERRILPFATAWIELESIMLSELSQAVKDKYHMISPLSGS